MAAALREEDGHEGKERGTRGKRKVKTRRRGGRTRGKGEDDHEGKGRMITSLSEPKFFALHVLGLEVFFSSISHRLLPIAHLLSLTSLPMAATPAVFWICDYEGCGKVCKSRGGLTKHSSTHNRHPCVGKSHNNLRRTYHPRLDGMSRFLFNSTSPELCKGDPVVEMENFSHPEHPPPPHP